MSDPPTGVFPSLNEGSDVTMASANGETSNVTGVNTTLAQAIHVPLPTAPTVQYVVMEAKAKSQAELFQKFCPVYCGHEDNRSSVRWVKEARNFMDVLLAGQSGPTLYFALLGKLTGDATLHVLKSEAFDVNELVANVLHQYPLHKHQERLLAKLRNNTAFKTSTRDTIRRDAERVLEDMAGIPSGPEAVALALYYISNEHWAATEIQAVYATTESVLVGLATFERRILASPNAVLRFGTSTMPAKPAPTKAEATKAVSEVPAAPPVVADGEAAKKKKNRYAKLRDKLKELEAEKAARTAESSTSTPKPAANRPKA
ncbi:hypothetical protein FBU31_000935 [Coemansia sp. 'formosensis']|nr:hypothetical protein FBU31_000935 [Coemansia sp. 'formosensis']